VNARFYSYPVSPESASADTPAIPGPALCIYPGDKINIDLINAMPGGDDNPQCPAPGDNINVPHCFNTTNLHFHGLHVSPSSLDEDGNPVAGSDGTAVISSDDVTYSLPPADSPAQTTTHPYCVEVPSFHAPGTHWFHAHQHGSTGIQVSNGMAGVIIVKEPPGDEIPGTEDAQDIIWLMQEVVTDSDDIYGTSKNTSDGEFLINGALRPTLHITEGELQRWRFINGTATPRGLMVLRLCEWNGDDQDTSTSCTDPDASLYLIAIDGITFYGKTPRAVTSLPLAPGNRADFLVNLPAGQYKVVKTEYRGTDFVNGGVDTGVQEPSQESEQVLAYIDVADGDSQSVTDFENTVAVDTIPTTGMPNYLRPFPDDWTTIPENPTPVNFEIPAGRQFEISGLQYDQPGAEYNVDLDSAECWELNNFSGRQRPITHPFHIHVNPFQVVAQKIDGEWVDVAPEDRVWQDTVAVDEDDTSNDPELKNYGLKILHRFEDYDGTFVIHCHILVHEDQGMMWNVTVNGDGVIPCEAI
jgi:FtsP/CotA-like multicopper oxidase with cupredoxin domain